MNSGPPAAPPSAGIAAKPAASASQQKTAVQQAQQQYQGFSSSGNSTNGEVKENSASASAATKNSSTVSAGAASGGNSDAYPRIYLSADGIASVVLTKNEGVVVELNVHTHALRLVVDGRIAVRRLDFCHSQFKIFALFSPGVGAVPFELRLVSREEIWSELKLTSHIGECLRKIGDRLTDHSCNRSPPTAGEKCQALTLWCFAAVIL